MHVSEIWRYPVKSMVGESIDVARLDDLGIVGDRTWAVRDEVRGGVRGAKKIGALMKLGARSRADGRIAEDRGGPIDVVDIDLPDGTTISSDDPRANELVSQAIDHEVTLWPLQPVDQLDHYRRGAPDSDDVMAELRGIFGRVEGEPFPDFAIFPPSIAEFESPPGTYLDAYPLMIMSTSALRSLTDALPESAIDIRRFRPSFVVDTGDESGHPEFDWVGRQLVIGDVVLDVPHPCPRCVMVTREIDETIPVDRTVLRHIVRDLGQNLGVYASVVTPGVIRAGDTVEVR